MNHDEMHSVMSHQVFPNSKMNIDEFSMSRALCPIFGCECPYDGHVCTNFCESVMWILSLFLMFLPHHMQILLWTCRWLHRPHNTKVCGAFSCATTSRALHWKVQPLANKLQQWHLTPANAAPPPPLSSLPNPNPGGISSPSSTQANVATGSHC
jgi:hypothetical protein